MEIYTIDHGQMGLTNSIKLRKNLFCLNVNDYLMIPINHLLIENDRIYGTKLGSEQEPWQEGDWLVGYYYK